MAEQQPWERQPGEPDLWWDRFERFRLTGSGRNLLATVNTDRDRRGQQRTPNAPTSWRRAAQKWHWVERATAWDAHVQEENRRVWAERQQAWREREYSLGQALLDKAEQMLRFPLTQVEKQDGDRITIIKPADWRLMDVAGLAATAQKLVRLAAEMSTSRPQIDFSKMGDDELVAYVTGELRRLGERAGGAATAQVDATSGDSAISATPDASTDSAV